MIIFQGTVADSFDSSEDDIFDGKFYITTHSKEYNKKKFLLSSKTPKINIKKEMPSTSQKLKNIHQSSNVLSNMRKSKSHDNFLSAMNIKNEPIYSGSYGTDTMTYFSNLAAPRKYFKVDSKQNKDWIQTKESCTPEGAIMGKDNNLIHINMINFLLYKWRTRLKNEIYLQVLMLPVR